VKEKIDLLVQLQECDNEIGLILNRKKEGPLKIRELQERLNTLKEKFQEDNSRLQALKKERLNLEQDVQDFENKLEKSNIKLSNIKSNKEYQAALNEIEELKKAKFQTEDRVLQVMESVEEMESICRGNKDKERELEGTFESTKAEVEEELAKMDRKLEEVEATRARLSQVIDGELLSRYAFLKERKNGHAISAVIDGVCQACHMNIPPQRYNDLIRGNALLTCPNCSRMIYWGEESSFKKATM